MGGVDALSQVMKEQMRMQCPSIQMPSDLTLAISKVLALFKEWIYVGKTKTKQSVLNLGETATTFCSFFPSKLSKNTIIVSAPGCRTASPAA